jgi:hypothetical protein
MVHVNHSTTRATTMKHYWAGRVKLGRTSDYEDSRETYRMQKTITILAGAGITPTITHGTRVYFDWATSRDRHHCSLDGSGNGDCKIEWTPWATDEDFDQAYEMACRTATNMGQYNRSR